MGNMYFEHAWICILLIILLLSRMDIVRNEEVRMRAGIERELASKADQRVTR